MKDLTIREHMMKLLNVWGFTEQIMHDAWKEGRYKPSTMDRTCPTFRPISDGEREEFEIKVPAFVFKPKGLAQTFILYCVPFTRGIVEYMHPRVRTKVARARMLKRAPTASFRAKRDDGNRRQFDELRVVA